MNFIPDEHQQQLADSVTRYLQDQHSFSHRQALLRDAAGGAARGAWRRFGEMGWLGMAAPPEHGGAGMGLAATAPVVEAFGARLVLWPYVNAALATTELLCAAASDAQRAEWLPPLVQGERLTVFAHEERGMRYRWNDVRTQARRTADGFVLSGSKQAVPAGDAADAWIVSARMEDGGLSLFHVPAPQRGVVVSSFRSLDDMPTADLSFDDVRLPPSSCIGEAGQAWPHIERALDVMLAASCIEALGAMAALHAQTVDYVKVRTQFGVPIGSFQVLRHRLADMFTQIELSRSLALVGLAAVEHGPQQPLLLSAVKAQVSAACRFVGEVAIQLHGGIGMTQEVEASHLFKRLVAIEKRMGDRHHHLGRLAAEIGAGRDSLLA
ncbi:MAG: acyl-CoA dehydrogenase family protein [Variovorax sp.]|nr:acyl-CoA dehydrogenase family protein [Variovorax sp.]